MKIAAIYCIYNEDEYIEYSIRSIYDFVDHVYVLLGQKPYSAYNARARDQYAQTDSTESIVTRMARTHSKISLHQGVWDSELEHRNAGLRLCMKDKHDYYFLVDGDEVYGSAHLANLHEEILQRPRVGQFIVKCDIFWRSFRYRILADELAWMPRRVFKLTRWSELGKSHIPIPLACSFTGNNKTNSRGGVYHIDPARVIFYHFSFARQPSKMLEKLSTYSHAHEIREGWYEKVWLGWEKDRGIKNLHPVDAHKFPRIVSRDLNDLPEVMKTHPYYGKDIID